ncbi:MAG: hypothetical protein ABI876_14920 [Bacteroidota bacterium]
MRQWVSSGEKFRQGASDHATDDIEYERRAVYGAIHPDEFADKKISRHAVVMIQFAPFPGDLPLCRLMWRMICHY